MEVMGVGLGEKRARAPRVKQSPVRCISGFVLNSKEEITCEWVVCCCYCVCCDLVFLLSLLQKGKKGRVETRGIRRIIIKKERKKKKKTPVSCFL